MAPKVRDRIINAVIMTCSGSAVAIIAFWLQSSDADAKEFNKKLDAKVDKVEFKEYKETHDKRHLREIESIQEDVKETKDMVLFLYERELKNN